MILVAIGIACLAMGIRGLVKRKRDFDAEWNQIAKENKR